MNQQACASTQTAAVPVAEWLAGLQERYLSEYIPAGGAAVKFVSGSDEVLEQARGRVLGLARELGFHTVFLDPAELTDQGKRPDFHRIDRFFFAVTRDVPWREWAQQEARRYLTDRLGLVIPPDCDLPDVDRIAGANDKDANFLLQQYEREADRRIRDRYMAVEFRAALTYLFMSQLKRVDTAPTTEEVLLSWLQGVSVRGGDRVLKAVQIYGKIGPTNARHYLTSFCHWLATADRTGLVIVLDFRPYENVRTTRGAAWSEIKDAIARGASATELQQVLERADAPAGTVYSAQAYARMLGVLRQFIDEIDQFRSMLLVVLTTPEYYTHTTPRNYHNYDALQTRIGLEVFDQHKADPDAALVHLRGEG